MVILLGAFFMPDCFIVIDAKIDLFLADKVYYSGYA